MSIPPTNKYLNFLHQQRQIWNQLNRNMRLFLATAFILGFTFEGGFFAVLFNLYLLRLGYDTAFIGFINGVGPLAFTLAAFPIGILSRTWDTRRIFIWGMSISTAGFFIIPLAEALPLFLQQAAIISGVVIFFIGLSTYFIMGPSFIMSNTTDRLHDHVFAWEGAVFSLAAFVGSLIAGSLPKFIAFLLGITTEHSAPYRYPLLLAAFLFALMVYLFTLVTNDDVRKTEVVEGEDGAEDAHGQPSSRWRSRARNFIVMLVLVRFFQTSGFAVANTFFNVYFDDHLNVSTAIIGGISAIARLVGVGAALASPLLIRRWGTKKALVTVGFLAAVSLLPLAWGNSWEIAGLGYVGMILTSRMRFSIFPVFVMDRTPIKERAWITSIQELVIGGSFALAGFAGGYLIQWAGYTPLFLTGCVFAVIGVAILWFYKGS